MYHRISYRQLISILITTGVVSLSYSNVWAATAINLNYESAKMLLPLAVGPKAAVAATAMHEMSRETDFNHTLHIRMQQTYRGYPVLGGDAILHIPHPENNKNIALTQLMAAKTATANGTVYAHLDQDLKQTPDSIFSASTAQAALEHVIHVYQADNQNAVISEQESKLMVYVDKKQQAHWVYKVSFYARLPKAMPAKPSYLIDALTMQIYQQWDDVQTLEQVKAGGYGGNRRTGIYTYDGDNIAKHFGSFMISREAASKTCYLRDDNVIVRDGRYNYDVSAFQCAAPLVNHHNLYWNGGAGVPDQEEFNNPDAVNGGYSPSNDAYYAAHIVINMYADWYAIKDPIRDIYSQKPIKLLMFTHDGAYDNAGWSGKYMSLGDGDKLFYPLTSLDVIAHEVSHGFTWGHGVLLYFGQSGGINEAFSDMAAQAAEVYATGANNWKIGADVFKQDNKALRYMDNPTHDCPEGKQPGEGCSIDNINNYNDTLNVHHTSGIFNKAFVLMSQSPNWNVKKAFGVMVEANMHYWTYNTTFNDAACGVLYATKSFQQLDAKYDTETVVNAFKAVGIDVTKCGQSEPVVS